MRLRLLESYGPTEKVALWVSLFLHICCAWFSLGFHHGDEHAQILEFANYKLGFTSEEKLPWEFEAQIRPALQPFLVFFIGKLMLLLGIYNPFTLAFLLRLMTALASWYATVVSTEYVKPFLTKGKQLLYFIVLSNFLWFIPYVHVRFSSEVLSGLFFFFALHQVLCVVERNSYDSQYLKSALIGALLAVSFWCRFQIGFAIVGLAFWLIVFKKNNLKFFLPTILTAILFSGGAVILDHWLYGNWIFTPYKYFKSNIIKNVAAQWGTSPWWDYFLQFLLQAGLPLSLILLTILALSIATNPKSPFVWIFITFLVGHTMVGHKELRFMFPMIFIYPICTFLFMKSERASYWSRLFLIKWVSVIGKILMAANTFLLVALIFFKPATIELPLHKFIYDQTKKRPVKLLALTTTYFEELPFYNASNFEFKRIGSLNELPHYLLEDTTVFFLDDHFELPDSIIGQLNISFDLQYRTLPALAQKLNFNGWVERTKVLSLYKPVLTEKK